MEKTVVEDEIDLLDLAGYLLNWIWLITICGVVAAGIAFCVAKFGMTPMYESTTKVYVLSKQNNSTITTGDLQVGTQLVKDYREMIKSRYVLEQVIELCELTDTYEQLSGRVTVSTPSDTRMITITVKDADPYRAKEIVDYVREVAADRIVKVMDLQAVNVVDEGNVSQYPSSPQTKKFLLAGLALGVVASAGVLVIVHLSDDTIKTSDDVEKYLNLSTLASIPLAEESKKTNKKSGAIHKKGAPASHASGHSSSHSTSQSSRSHVASEDSDEAEEF